MECRTISEILVDADNSNSLWQLHILDSEISRNRYAYPLIQLEFALEHLQEARTRILK